MSRGDYGTARQKADQIGKIGGEPGEIYGEISRAEQEEFGQLENRFQQLKQRNDEEAIKDFRELLQQFRSIADGGGGRAQAAGNYVEKLIPATISEIETRVANKKADDAFKRAVDHYNQAVRAKAAYALMVVQEEFQAIAREQGPHAEEARRYVEEISSKTTDRSALQAASDRQAIQAVLEISPLMEPKDHHQRPCNPELLSAVRSREEPFSGERIKGQASLNLVAAPVHLGPCGSSPAINLS